MRQEGHVCRRMRLFSNRRNNKEQNQKTPAEKESARRGNLNAKKERSRRWGRVSLSALMSKGDWDKVRETITPPVDPLLSILPYRALEECTDFTGQTALHLAVKNEAPYDVIEMIVDALPAFVQTTDCLGQTPLHVLASLCYSVAAARLFIGVAPVVVGEKDCNGHTPLHLACKSLSRPSTDEGKPSIRDIQRTIRMLVQACPKAMHETDLSGKRPKEYAEESNDADSTFMEVFQTGGKYKVTVSNDSSEVLQDQQLLFSFGTKRKTWREDFSPPLGRLSFPTNWIEEDDNVSELGQ